MYEDRPNKNGFLTFNSVYIGKPVDNNYSGIQCKWIIKYVDYNKYTHKNITTVFSGL